MLKSFKQFINESMDQHEEFIKGLAQSLTDKLRTSQFSESKKYTSFSGMEFIEPFAFDLILHVRRDSNPILDQDNHFNGLPWEKINFDRLGYCIDANTKMSKNKAKVPKIVMHLIINPKDEPILYSKLYYRLLDILTHETNHLDQLGLNRNPFNTTVSSKAERDNSKKNYKYFLLKEEIESMIEGMQVRSKAQNIPLDQVFDEYLEPFIESGYITMSEYIKVLETWVKRAAELYPDATFSNRVSTIINSI